MMNPMKLNFFSKANMKDVMRSAALWLIVPLAIYFSFGFHHLASFETTDEHYWSFDNGGGRIMKYWLSVASKDWPRTRVDNKPGITLAYVSGTGILSSDNPFIERNVSSDGSWRNYDPEITMYRNLAYRIPLIVFNGLLALFFFWAIKRLSESQGIALVASSLILLSPILLGISQIVNPDALLWSFSFAAILESFLFFKERKKKDAALAAVFLGLSFLTKYTAVILIPFFAVMMLVYLFYGYEGNDRADFAKRAIRSSLGYFIILAISLAIYSIMMPAVFFNKSYFLSNGDVGGIIPLLAVSLIIGAFVFLDAFFLKSSILEFSFRKLRFFRKAIIIAVSLFLAALFFATLLNWSVGNNFLHIKDIPFDAAQAKIFRKAALFQKMILELRPAVFSLTPIVLFFLIYAWMKSAWKNDEQRVTVLGLSIFALVFYAGVIVQGLLVDIRYSIVLYPAMALLAAIGVCDFFRWEKLRASGKLLVFGGVILASSISLWLAKPFYFNYTNDLLPKDQLIAYAWGYGGYEAAQYLNSLPDVENMTVWSDFEGFCPFFKGKCVRGNELSNHVFKEKGSQKNIDYFISTRRGNIKEESAWQKLDGFYDKKPVFEMLIDGRPDNFVKVYKATRPTTEISSKQ